mgnify:CR=1 FL=1
MSAERLSKGMVDDGVCFVLESVAVVFGPAHGMPGSGGVVRMGHQQMEASSDQNLRDRLYECRENKRGGGG